MTRNQGHADGEACNSIHHYVHGIRAKNRLILPFFLSSRRIKAHCESPPGRKLENTLHFQRRAHVAATFSLPQTRFSRQNGRLLKLPFVNTPA